MKKIKNLKELANRIATEFDPVVKEAAMNTLEAELFRRAKPVNWDNVSGVYILFDGDEAEIATSINPPLKKIYLFCIFLLDICFT